MPEPKKERSADHRPKRSSQATSRHTEAAKPYHPDSHPEPSAQSSKNLHSPDSKQPPSRPAIPMPVAPERLPSKRAVPMVKTTYNSTRVRNLGLLGAGIAVVGLAGLGWITRDQLTKFWPALTAPTPTPFHLSVAPTSTPDAQQVEEIYRQLLRQSSASAELVNSASPSAALAEHISNQPSVTLEAQLDDIIKQLGSDGVNVSNLEAYRKRIDGLQAKGETNEAHQWLIEAVTHAYEMEFVHRYYQK